MTNVDLIQSFKQGKVRLQSDSSLGNCASIALIKASIEIFGLDNVFEYEKVEETYIATLKNGKTITITENELTRSNHVANFTLNELIPEKLDLYTRIHAYAQLAMCIMTKHVVEIGEAGHGQGDFESALIAINDGANTENLPKVLGLEDYFSRPKWGMSKRRKAMIGWLKGHTVYLSQGWYDYYGKPKKIRFYKYPKRMQLINY